MITPEVGLDLCRFLHDAAAMLLWGALAYLAALVPAPLASVVDRRLRVFRVAAIAVAVATTAAALPLEAAYVGNGWPDAFDLPTLTAVLFDTGIGSAWMVQAALALLLIAAAAASPKAWRQVATAIAAGILLASLALTGHAVMHGGLVGIGQRINDALHVLAGGAWLGALVPLLIVMPGLGDPARRDAARAALNRFSVAGHGAVALVIATGVANTFLILGHWPTDWASPYQAMLTAQDRPRSFHGLPRPPQSLCLAWPEAQGQRRRHRAARGIRRDRPRPRRGGSGRRVRHAGAHVMVSERTQGETAHRRAVPGSPQFGRIDGYFAAQGGSTF